jgi:hypothetical protein
MRTRKELQTLEALEKALLDEVSASAEFDLPLTALALVIEGRWQEEDIRRALDALPTAEELLVALPDNMTADARVVEERLREALP